MIYLIHGKKYIETAKMGRQRKMPQMKGQEESPKKELNELVKEPTTYRVEITSYKNAQRT